MMGMGGGFMLVSPAFRGTVMHGVTSALTLVEHNGPYSYIGIGLALFAVAGIALNQQPRPQ
jgi:hypothetical protein